MSPNTPPTTSTSASTVTSTSSSSTSATSSYSLLDRAIGAVAAAGRSGVLTQAQEDALVDATLRGAWEPVSALAAHYPTAEFARHALRNLPYLSQPLTTGHSSVTSTPIVINDCIVIGGGLAGMTAALTILDRGGRVVLLEKEAYLGGNSARASSGLNGIDGTVEGDSADVYMQDILKAAQGDGVPELLEAMVHLSSEGLEWVRSRLQIALEKTGQLGGHSYARTHRPAHGLAGTELVVAIQRQLKPFEGSRLRILKSTRAQDILVQDGNVLGVRIRHKDGRVEDIAGNNVLIATGGFAADSGEGGLLDIYRPDLRNIPTTNGAFATGDGLKMALKLGAVLIGMKDVQVHPTGFIDPEDELSMTKVLCAEILRGVGGLLFNINGSRFCDELGNRGYVTARISEQPRRNLSIAEAFLILNQKAALEADKHVPMYEKKGLLQRFEQVTDLGRWMGVDSGKLVKEMKEYDKAAVEGKDMFGKIHFHNMPWVDSNTNEPTGPFHAGRITPVVHYTMGGIAIDAKGRVKMTNGSWVKGLYAAGEAAGGIHGKMRLGGNALTECVVFGLAVGRDVQIGARPYGSFAADTNSDASTQSQATLQQGKQQPTLRSITKAELAAHDEPNSVWVALFDKVYEFSGFLDEHPGGPKAILNLKNKDGTHEYLEVHTKQMLDDFEPIGVLVD
eukprot:c5720_g1_i1.p1 GENE.c5720_g1_i1~~c5720_g1_i1.p1  ORF type:complete len:697 (+),score=184.63 c5720_g1_i1:59-2092(+)